MNFQLGDSKEIRAHAAACVIRIVAGECPFLPNVGTVGGISSPLSVASGALMIVDALTASIPRVKVRRVRSVASVDGRIEAVMGVQ